jgi:pilus assembly protein Flp/PilA
MEDRTAKRRFRWLNLLSREAGQDLVEYALVVAMIAFATTAGFRSVALQLSNVYTQLGTTLTNTT